MLLELMEMFFFPLIGHIIVLQKRFNQFEYELLLQGATELSAIVENVESPPSLHYAL